MIYQKSIVFNELSVSFINEEQKIIVLENFYHLCLSLISLSGKCLDNPQKSNFQEILFYENFDRSSIYPKNSSFQDVERIRLKKMFIEREMPSVPEYRFEGEECKGLGYAHEQEILSISLETDEKWKKRNLQIDKIKNDEKLTTSQVDVKNNIANLDNAFEILEQFADKFYENCHSEKIYFEADPKNKKSKNFTHNLLPLKEISNLYLTYKQFYEEIEKWNEIEKKTEIFIVCKKDVTEKKQAAKIITKINGWEVCNSKGRVIYKHKGTKYYLSNDTEKADFEIQDSKGKHCGAISFDCNKQEGYKEKHDITPC
jgi:YHS domain-containing protein